VNHGSVVLSTVMITVNSGWTGLSLGAVLKQARDVREMSAADVARSAGISGAYLSKLEGDAVKKPSPLVLNQLSQALSIPYAELMMLSGYPLPTQPTEAVGGGVAAALFADLTAEERDEMIEYLAWYRARRRAGRGGNRRS